MTSSNYAMKQIDGLQINNRIFRYGSKIFQTDGGFLLKFTSGTEAWQGIFPGCSWDRFYDDIMIDLNPTQHNPKALAQRFLIPTLIVSFKDVGICAKDECTNSTVYKFCSISCWFFDTIDMTRRIISRSHNQEEIEQQVAFVEQLAKIFGTQVDEEQANLIQLSGDAHSAS